MICLSDSFIFLQKLFKKVNLCIKKEEKERKINLFAFTAIPKHWQLIKNLWDPERARGNWDSN